MITELVYTVNKQGSLKIPKDAIREMGLQAGDHVRVAFLSTDGEKNDYCELMIYGEQAEEDKHLPEYHHDFIQSPLHEASSEAPTPLLIKTLFV